MQHVTAATAWTNGAIGYLAWDVRSPIEDCLGFMVTRVHETGDDAGTRRVLPAWLGFIGQSNPDWAPQDTSVWPVQRFDVRDLTLRRSRDTTTVRPTGFSVHYEVVPVGPPAPDRVTLEPALDPTYQGAPVTLATIGEPTPTNSVEVTWAHPGEITAVFNNGILSTQSLARQLGPAAGALARLKAEIADPTSQIRAFLAGDVPETLSLLLERTKDHPGSAVYAALYELTDPVLLPLLEEAVGDGRANVILATTGDTAVTSAGAKATIWDAENDPARRRLHDAATRTGAGTVIDRMFCNAGHIGHNKFVVYVQDNHAASVITGSTNWTENGLCAQSNNAILVEQSDVADAYLRYWHRLADDPQPAPIPAQGLDGNGNPVVGSAPNDAVQGTALRTANAAVNTDAGPISKAAIRVWGAPVTTQSRVPQNPALPVDLADVYALMDGAQHAIFMLTFMPGKTVIGTDPATNVIAKAVELAVSRPELLITAAISSPDAMPQTANAPEPETYTGPDGRPHKLPPKAIWSPPETHRIVMVRAAARSIPYGDLRPELLSAGFAIIHDKVVVVDPLDPVNCAVITGSHNLGYKASYANDDNLLMVRGNSSLSVAYAIHAFDLYEHYTSRGLLEDRLRADLKAGKYHSLTEAAKAHSTDASGILHTPWKATPRSGGVRDYFLSGG